MNNYITNNQGTSFFDGTQQRVMDIIQNAINNRTRIRVFYGDKETGKDWLEAYDTIGRISRSCGSVRMPILINNKRSVGGCIVPTDCIVKITIDKQVVYQHPKYHCPVERRGNDVYDTEENKCIFHTTSEANAERELQFFLGNRNAH